MKKKHSSMVQSQKASLEPESALLKKIITKGIGWLALKRVFAQIISTASNLVLVRLLFPDDFGSFAIIQFLISIFWIFADIGFGKALVQRKKDPDAALLRSVWWIQVALSLLIGTLIWLTAPVLISYYSDQVLPEATLGLRWLVVGQILVNLSLVSASLLERHLRYSRIVVCELTSLFTTQLVSIFFALLGFGVEALVIGFIAGKAVILIAYSILSPWPWGVSFNFSKLKSVLKFGFSYQISGLLGIAGAAVLPLFLGRFPGPGGYSGSEAVGFVTWAGGVGALTVVVPSVIEPIIFPLISRLQSKPEVARKLFIRVLRVTSISIFPLAVLLIALAPQIIQIIYTPVWLPGLISLRLATIQTVILGLSSLTLLTLLGLGEAKFVRNIHFLLAILQWVFTIPLVLIFGFWGYNLAAVLAALVSVYAVVKLKEHLKINFLSVVALPFIISVFIGLLTLVLAALVNISNVFELIFVAGISFLVYLGLTFLLSKEALMKDFKTLKEIIVGFRLSS